MLPKMEKHQGHGEFRGRPLGVVGLSVLLGASRIWLNLWPRMPEPEFCADGLVGSALFCGVPGFRYFRVFSCLALLGFVSGALILAHPPGDPDAEVGALAGACHVCALAWGLVFGVASLAVLAGDRCSGGAGDDPGGGWNFCLGLHSCGFAGIWALDRRLPPLPRSCRLSRPWIRLPPALMVLSIAGSILFIVATRSGLGFVRFALTSAAAFEVADDPGRDLASHARA